MKQKFLLKTMLLLCALVVGLGNAWADAYSGIFKKITSTSDFTTGFYVVAASESASSNADYALGNSVDGNKRMTGVSVSISSGTTITNPDNAIVWYITVSGSTITMQNVNNSKYLYQTGTTSGKGMGLTTTSTNLTLAGYNSNSPIGFKFTLNGASNNIFKYNTSNTWFANYSGDYATNMTPVRLFKLSYSVTYDANGGTGTMTDASSPYFGGSTVTVKSNSFTKDGYNFNGWNTKANGSGTSYAEGATFSISENTTLYAQWVAAGDYISSTPTSADIETAGDVAEFELSTNLADPTYAIKYYTTADGDVETSKPAWLGDVEFSGSTLDIVVNENTGVTRTAYFKVYSGDTYSDVITINQAAYVAVTSVSLDITSETLLVENTVTLVATVYPANASYKTITWESDDTGVATVTSAGVVTAVAAGRATITVKSTDDPTKKATCTITVTDGSIDLDTTGEIEITSFPSFSGSGYQSSNPYTIGGYDWIATNCMLSSSYLQLRKSDGVLTSPTIKSTKGFTITVTVPTNSVTVSDGTNSASTSDGVATLTTTKTSTTITISAGGSYAQVSKIKITPTKDPIATGVSITDPGTLAKDATGTFEATSTDAADCTKEWSSSDGDVITVSPSTGAYEAIGRGTAKITYTITPVDTENYGSVSAEIDVNVTAPVVITASDVAMTYGDAAKAIGATTSEGYAGTLAYVSGNPAIATVDASGNVTAVAVGTTTITISAPADAGHLYTAGDDVVIDVTVSAPVGGTTAKTTTPIVVTSNTLLSSSLPDGWTGDGSIWHGESSYGAVASNGTNGSTYDLKTATINLNGNYSAASVTFQHTGKTFSTPSNACKLYVKDGDTETQLTIGTYFAGNSWTYVTNTTSLDSYIGKSIQLIFRYTPASGDNGKWEIENFAVNATPAATESVSLNASGYATFCSQYPLDFSDYATADYSAWQITDISSSNVITFEQVTGSVKGGTGLFLKGERGETITLTSANSTNTLGDNMLEGTLAPTYVAANKYYGLSGGDFVKVNAGTVKAGKAILDADWVEAAGLVKAFTFIFDDEATGIRTIETVSAEEAAEIFDLSGRRLNKIQKGINIVNGKKILY